MRSRPLQSAALSALAVAMVPMVVWASPDPVSITSVRAGHGKIVVTLQAGPSGAPAGFSMWWMTRSMFEASGSRWFDGVLANKDWAAFTGTPIVNTDGGTITTYRLAPDEEVVIEIGDLADETGVQSSDRGELEPITEYVFTGYANPEDDFSSRSALSATVSTTTTVPGSNCTYTIGFWKTHPGMWPVASLMLGSVSYTQAELLQILDQPSLGNGLTILAKQLIAAKLNLAAGASPIAVASTISWADLQIGSLVVPPIGTDALDPATTSAATQTLDDFNNGLIGPGHCGTTPAVPGTWGQLKSRYR
jgi:hypothetical protein